jgi:hypothetical protein
MMAMEQSFSYDSDKVRSLPRISAVKEKQLVNNKINHSGGDFADHLYKIIDSEMSSIVDEYRKTRGGKRL